MPANITQLINRKIKASQQDIEAVPPANMNAQATMMKGIFYVLLGYYLNSNNQRHFERDNE